MAASDWCLPATPLRPADGSRDRDGRRSEARLIAKRNFHVLPFQKNSRSKEAIWVQMSMNGWRIFSCRARMVRPVNLFQGSLKIKRLCLRHGTLRYKSIDELWKEQYYG